MKMKQNIKKLFKKTTYLVSVSIVGLMLGVGFQFAKAWTEPGSAPPAGNVGAPINTGTQEQTKYGPFSVGVSQTGSKLSIDGSGLDAGNNYSNVSLVGSSAGGAGYLKSKIANWGGYFNWMVGSGSGDVELMRINATSRNVGIGTTTTPVRLTVVDGSNFTAGFIGGYNNNGVSMGSYGASGVPFLQGYNDTLTTPKNLALQVSGGNVGIGTAGSIDAGLQIKKAGPNGSLAIENQYAGGITHFDYPDGRNYIRGTTIIADAGGNVGIGTVNPGEKLDVLGNVHIKEIGSYLYPKGDANNDGVVDIADANKMVKVMVALDTCVVPAYCDMNNNGTIAGIDDVLIIMKLIVGLLTPQEMTLTGSGIAGNLNVAGNLAATNISTFGTVGIGTNVTGGYKFKILGAGATSSYGGASWYGEGCNGGGVDYFAPNPAADTCNGNAGASYVCDGVTVKTCTDVYTTGFLDESDIGWTCTSSSFDYVYYDSRVVTCVTEVGVAILESTGDSGSLTLKDSDGTCNHNPESGSETVNCSSDERLKTNITNASSSLDELMKFKVKDYTVKASDDKMTGVIAQEVQQVLPGYVSMGPDGYYSVSQVNSWKFVKAIQEQQQQINDLKNQIETLKNNK